MYIIYHNPRCSKSRKTLAILNENNMDVKIIEYLKNPPSTKQLESISSMLKMGPLDFMRKNEPEFKELGLDRHVKAGWELCEIMSNNPKLIERPIVIKGDKAIIGRPPENVIKLF